MATPVPEQTPVPSVSAAAPPASAEPPPTAVAPPGAVPSHSKTLPLGKRTVMGIAPPTPVLPPGTPIPPPEPPEPPSPPPPPPEGGAPALAAAPPMGTLVMPPPPNVPGPSKTILGVARPGIAPLNPGVAKTAPPEPFLSPPPPPPSPAQQEIEPAVPEARRPPWLAFGVLFAALVLLAGGLWVFFSLRGQGAIEAKLALSPDGKERLELSCPNCKEGERVRLGEVGATFLAGHTQLEVPSALKVGDNRFELVLSAPGSTRENRVAVTVPLEYRVRGDTSSLAQPVPTLTVRVEAIPGSTVVVDGHAVPLAANGQAVHTIDVSKELSGLESSVRKLERRVPYVITPPNRPAQKGEVTFQTGVAPLTIEAPGDSITIETPTFVLAGRTLKGGTVTVGERPITLEPDGHFIQNLSVSALGETSVSVRASAPDFAPRSFSFRVRRVANLADEGRAARASATASYDAIATALEQKRGWKVALDGSVIEVGGSELSSLFLLDVKSGCKTPPCLVKVVHGAHLTLALGERVSVFGVLRGAVAGPRSGTQVPEVLADFVVKGRR